MAWAVRKRWEEPIAGPHHTADVTGPDQPPRKTIKFMRDKVESKRLTIESKSTMETAAEANGARRLAMGEGQYYCLRNREYWFDSNRAVI
jgi:hypothetical protein